MPSAPRFPLLRLGVLGLLGLAPGLVSCASGGDDSSAYTGDDGGMTSSGLDGASGDSSLGAADVTVLPDASEASAVDTGARDTSKGDDETGPGIDSGAVGDTGDVDVDAEEESSADAASGETSVGDAAGDAGRDASGDAGVREDAGTSDAGPADAGPPEAGEGDSGVCPGHGITGALVTFDLTGQTGSETSAAATFSAAGVAGGPLSRSTGLTAVSGADSINSSGWAQGATANKGLYYTFTVTPVAGCTVTLESLAIDVKASPTGPAVADVGTSVDNFAALSTAFAGTSNSNVTLSASSSGAITIHVFGYSATASAGTLRIDGTMTLSGTLD